MLFVPSAPAILVLTIRAFHRSQLIIESTPRWVAHDAILASLTSRHRFAALPTSLTGRPSLPVMALATILLAPVPSLGRCDEITYLVGKAPPSSPHTFCWTFDRHCRS
jgi:hypothetical protein